MPDMNKPQSFMLRDVPYWVFIGVERQCREAGGRVGRRGPGCPVAGNDALIFAVLCCCDAHRLQAGSSDSQVECARRGAVEARMLADRSGLRPRCLWGQHGRLLVVNAVERGADGAIVALHIDLRPEAAEVAVEVVDLLLERRQMR